MADERLIDRLAEISGIDRERTGAIVALFEGKATVPFVARYRKEITGGLSEDKVQGLHDRRRQLLRLQSRKRSMLRAIRQANRLTDEVRQSIEGCFDRNELEDLFVPFKPKPDGRAEVARQKGLEPLARCILDQKTDGPIEEAAGAYVSEAPGVGSVEEALAGARHILVQWLSEDAGLRRALRQLTFGKGLIRSQVTEQRKGQPGKFEPYYDFSTPVKQIVPHRYLELRRGEKENWLQVGVHLDEADVESFAAERVAPNAEAMGAALLREAFLEAYRAALAPSIETDVRIELKKRSDDDAIAKIAKNLRNLLLLPTGGPVRVLAASTDRAGSCKLAVVDQDGAALESGAVAIGGAEEQQAQAKGQILDLINRHAVEAVVMGNSAVSRGLGALLRDVLKDLPDQELARATVSEAGVTSYASSKAAKAEFPGLDPSARAAVSLGRRFQDPLAELVRADPKAIAAGQYLHDVNQKHLRNSLDAVAESCVSFVGVDVNAASAALLARVPGLDNSLAEQLVKRREAQGPYPCLTALRSVPGFGDGVFQQSAGFLRIHGGTNVLDCTAIHPTRYPLVEQMARDQGLEPPALLGNTEAIDRIDLGQYVSDSAGMLTLEDIRQELRAAGRDPRKPFRRATYRDDVATIEDLKVGMMLEGTVTNVTSFGAFVDIGVPCDGLIHVSQLSGSYVRDPLDAICVGDVVMVKILSLDLERKRIALSMRDSQDRRPPGPRRKRRRKPKTARPARPEKRTEEPEAREESVTDLARRLGQHFSR